MASDSRKNYTVVLMRHKVGPKPHDNPAAFANVSPDDMQKVVEKYVA